MPNDNMFETSLEEASMKQFGLLFTMLLFDPSPEGYKKFEDGLDKLVEVAAKVDELIQKKYERLPS